MNEKDESEHVDKAVAEAMKSIGGLAAALNDTLLRGLALMEEQVDHVIRNRITDENRLEYLLDNMLEYTMVDDGLNVFKRLCRYSYPLYPELVADCIMFYKKHST
jgi:hypothetical protein